MYTLYCIGYTAIVNGNRFGVDIQNSTSFEMESLSNNEQFNKTKEENAICAWNYSYNWVYEIHWAYECMCVCVCAVLM